MEEILEIREKLDPKDEKAELDELYKINWTILMRTRNLKARLMTLFRRLKYHRNICVRVARKYANKKAVLPVLYEQSIRCLMRQVMVKTLQVFQKRLWSEDLFKKANSKIKNNLYGEEIVLICKNLKPSPLCAVVLGELRRRFSKKSNQDTLVSELYKHLSEEPERLVNQATASDERRSVEQIGIAVRLLFIQIPELLVATCKSQISEQTKDIPEVNEKEYGPLSYLMGSIISKMFRTSRFRKTKSILESNNREELQDLLQSMKRPDFITFKRRAVDSV